ncbi:putative toxin-antitoxin system toxin component, PIN family [Microcoleus sp. LAD1_D5]|uniref:putative toxin-antitoxin system toxin component, PIN family n=1 Tax=unclassified Microcoleus TaxID=2642155 RepID=UPI002FCF2E9A
MSVTSYLIFLRKAIDFPRDRKDAKFLACALAGNANFLITGDRDFTEVETLGNTKIVSVSGFLDQILEEGED